MTASESRGCNLGRSAPGLCKIDGLLRVQLVKKHRTPPVLPIIPVLYCSRMLRLINRAVPAKCLNIWSRRQPARGQQTYTKLRAHCVVSLEYSQPRESCQISPQPANGAAEKQYSAAWDNLSPAAAAAAAAAFAIKKGECMEDPQSADGRPGVRHCLHEERALNIVADLH